MLIRLLPHLKMLPRPPLELCNEAETEESRETPVCFYELKFYALSNFSAFEVEIGSMVYPTAEHAYQAAKFPETGLWHNEVANAPSAHAAMKIAQGQPKPEGWDDRKREIMKDICRRKLEQHDYVQDTLQFTGDREIFEVSPTDSFWGWGPDRAGRNELGKIWMELRTELRDSFPPK